MAAQSVGTVSHHLKGMYTNGKSIQGEQEDEYGIRRVGDGRQG